MKHLIIGNGPAGVIAAETIRANKRDDDILLVGSEPEAPYSRTAITHLLTGDIRECDVLLRKDPDHFERLRIEQRRARIVRIDCDERLACTDNGDALEFDRLLIATGASPFLPLIPGIDAPGVHACWTLADARRILALAKPQSRVVLVGAGFVGCVLMEALALRGVRLAVIEKGGGMLPNMMAAGAGRMIRRWCERKGIGIRTAARVISIDSGSPLARAPLTVRLSDGESLPADLVVCATGVRPNIGFLSSSGIRCSQGVMVDAAMETNVPGIYAAGDCAEAYDRASGRMVIAGVQTNAADQAYCAALNMSGRPAFQRSVRQIEVVDTLGLLCVSLGQWQGVSGGQWAEVSDEARFRYLRLEFSQDVLVGANTIGLNEYTGMLRELIRQRVALGTWKDRLLQDPARLKEAYCACAQQEYTGAAAQLA